MTDIFSPPDSPYSLFSVWMDDAKLSEPSDPDAACLATLDEHGLPDARVVLIRKIDARGFCFFTNYHSAKGQELEKHPSAAINFHWKTCKRQIRVRGAVQKVSPDESDDYYATRPLENRIGAWASFQSQILDHRDGLVARVAEFQERFGDAPPRPHHWGGYRLVPQSIEFWQEGQGRLHHRLRYHMGDGADRNDGAEGGWRWVRLYP